MILQQILLDFHWSQLLQPQFYVENGGLFLILFVVFAETGLFAGFFLPGDSLLFVTGIFAHEIKDSVTGELKPGLGYQFLKLVGMGDVRHPIVDLLVLLVLISLAGIIGNTVGYWFGRKVGPTMYTWKDTLLFKQKYLTQAHDFYEKHGGGAIVIARFIPIVRTFAPIVAGIVGMDKKKFIFFNIVGCVAWVFSMLFGGYYLQKWIWDWFQFDLKEHLEVIVLGIVLVTTAPVLIKLFFSKTQKTKA